MDFGRTSHVAHALAKLPATLIEIVVSYTEEHLPTLSCCFNSRMEVAGNEPLQNSFSGFAVRMSDGTVTSWGSAFCDNSSVRKELTNVKALCGAWGNTKGASFASIVGEEGRVVTWGKMEDRGDCSEVVRGLDQVVGLCSSGHAFAALKKDGTVTTWGDARYGGESSPVQSQLKGVKTIYSSYGAFVAVLHDGSVVAWGNPRSGGMIPPAVQKRLKNGVQYICGNYGAFAALLNDRTVATWGDKDYGGSGPGWWKSLSGVVLLCAADLGFAALKKDGTVICWGDFDWSGPERVKRVEQVVALASTQEAFAAAVKSDGSVVTWGMHRVGGDSSEVAEELKGVVAIRGNKNAFAAIKTHLLLCEGTAQWSRGECQIMVVTAGQCRVSSGVWLRSVPLVGPSLRGGGTALW